MSRAVHKVKSAEMREKFPENLPSEDSDTRSKVLKRHGASYYSSGSFSRSPLIQADGNVATEVLPKAKLSGDAESSLLA